MKVYLWNNPIPAKGDVQAIGETLDAIAQRTGILLPKVIIEEARPVSSPLHPQFEWDDTAAAHEYRLHQARKLVQSVCVQIVQPTGETRTRAFVFLANEGERGYRDTVAVLNNEQTRGLLLRDALKELNNFRHKWATLSELAEVFRAIEHVETKITEPRMAAV